MKSIQRQLLLWLLGGILLATSVAGVGIYLSALAEANKLFDYQIQQAALSLPAHISDDMCYQNEQLEEDIVIQVWNPREKLIYTSNPELSLPHYKIQGFQTVDAFGTDWRIYSENRRRNFVQIAQPASVRDYLAASLAMRSLLPFLVLIPAMLVMASVMVRRQLAPLQTIAKAVKQRSPTELKPLSVDDHVPAELCPIVHALNDLLVRLDKALSAQRAFIADAAHELRSPLTALKLQLQLAERAQQEPQRTQAIGKLHERLNRTIHLVEQMLTLARQEVTVATLPLQTVALDKVVQQVCRDYRASEATTHAAIAMNLPNQSVLIQGDEHSLRILLKNLLENALHYTPAEGYIRVSLWQASPQVVLTLTDNGPGIDTVERARVFDRFYRCTGNKVTGTGLGLAIVKQIVEQHQADIELADNPAGQGLQVVIRFPALETLKSLKVVNP